LLLLKQNMSLDQFFLNISIYLEYLFRVGDSIYFLVFFSNFSLSLSLSFSLYFFFYVGSRSHVWSSVSRASPLTTVVESVWPSSIGFIDEATGKTSTYVLDGGSSTSSGSLFNVSSTSKPVSCKRGWRTDRLSYRLA